MKRKELTFNFHSTAKTRVARVQPRENGMNISPRVSPIENALKSPFKTSKRFPSISLRVQNPATARRIQDSTRIVLGSARGAHFLRER